MKIVTSEGASCLVGARNAACGREGKGDTRTDADKVCCEKFLNREYTLIHVCCDLKEKFYDEGLVRKIIICT